MPDAIPDPLPSAPATSSRDSDARIVARLRSVEGHVRGVQRMVEEGAYCVEVVHQIDAVQKALGKVSALLLDRHLRHCATAAIRGDDPAERERVLGELLDVFEAGRR
ncbi:MAG: metal-sensitive transcriptional regulator [Gemmatimonadetes bacterium]|nr:metal-sensitive transcriptional regulator [Gemmatimonadota bacterium]NNF38444.1 metal-sensitive transcriptional regulator [Gemmatimonadota bacterium]NNK64750.1 metal-sensitive transcriptional regulator [Gemmatimonadota bacterium]